jgi:hypothetical protein
LSSYVFGVGRCALLFGKKKLSMRMVQVRSIWVYVLTLHRTLSGVRVEHIPSHPSALWFDPPKYVM